MDVYEAPHGVYFSEPVEAGLAARKPQNPGQDPIASGKSCSQFRRPYLPGWPPAHEYRIYRLSRTYPSADDVPPSRRAIASPNLTWPIAGSRYRIAPDFSPLTIAEYESLL